MALPDYGLDADLKAKQAAKYDANLEREVVDWIEALTGQSKGEQSVHEWMRDGQLLCALVNVVKPGTIKKVSTSKLAFKQMENITFFMQAARELGVPESSMFGTPALYEDKDMGSVIACINAFGGAVQVTCPEFEGPKLGIAFADQSHRDQKREKKMATQSGGYSGTLEQQSASTAPRQVAAAAATYTGGAVPGTASGTTRPAGAPTPAPRSGGYTGAAAKASAAPERVEPAEAYGLDADLKQKQEAKFDTGLEKDVCNWIEAITGEEKGEQSTYEWLKSGQVLCELANRIKPGSIAKVNKQSMPFKQMENITFFMNFARSVRVPESSMFGTPDLYENKNMGSVVACLYALGGAVQVHCPDFDGPKLGVAHTIEAKNDQRRNNTTATSQYEAMQRCMEVERPKDMGVMRGAQ